MKKFGLLWLIVCLATAQLCWPGSVPAADGTPRLGSVGLQVVPIASGELVVLQVLTGTPAAAAGMKPGDLIVRIDAYDLAGSDFAEVVSKHLWGPVGSRAGVVFLRPGESGRRTVTLKRIAVDPKLTVSPALIGPSGQGEK